MLTCAIITLSFVIWWRIVEIVKELNNNNASDLIIGILVHLGFITMAILGIIGVSKVY